MNPQRLILLLDRFPDSFPAVSGRLGGDPVERSQSYNEMFYVSRSDYFCDSHEGLGIGFFFFHIIIYSWTGIRFLLPGRQFIFTHIHRNDIDDVEPERAIFVLDSAQTQKFISNKQPREGNCTFY